MEELKSLNWKLKYHCDNCQHNWIRKSDCMIKEDSCPICTVLARPENSVYAGE